MEHKDSALQRCRTEHELHEEIMFEVLGTVKARSAHLSSLSGSPASPRELTGSRSAASPVSLSV